MWPSDLQPFPTATYRHSTRSFGAPGRSPRTTHLGSCSGLREAGYSTPTRSSATPSATPSTTCGLLPRRPMPSTDLSRHSVFATNPRPIHSDGPSRPRMRAHSLFHPEETVKMLRVQLEAVQGSEVSAFQVC